MNQNIEILRDTDPRCSELEAHGYTLVGESWGARLRLSKNDDLSEYSDSLVKVLDHGVEIRELGNEFAEVLLDLELTNNSDYPYTPATFRVVPTLESIRALWLPDHRNFGAISEGVLIGAISTSRKQDMNFLANAQGVSVNIIEDDTKDEIVELDFASILREFRGNGIGKALASVAILEWTKSGVFTFATGGAAVNAASLGTVTSLGFSIEERWRSYQLSM